jgi:hypothetical protein
MEQLPRIYICSKLDAGGAMPTMEGRRLYRTQRSHNVTRPRHWSLSPLHLQGRSEFTLHLLIDRVIGVVCIARVTWDMLRSPLPPSLCDLTL